MNRKIFCLTLIFLFIIAEMAFAMGKRPKKEIRPEDIYKDTFIKSAGENKVLEIALIDCITYALENNSEIKIKRIKPKLREDDIRIANANFEPTLNFDYTLSDSSKETVSAAYPEVLESKDEEFSLGLSGKLVTGTEYDIDFLNAKHENNITTQRINSYYTSKPKITITQPLFKDSSIIVNRADITIARNNKKESEEDFKETVMDIITRTKMAYYDYVYWLENYAIAELSLKRANDLFQINKARYDKGLVSSVDLLEAETAVAQRKKTLLSAESALKKAEDELKLITNLIDDAEIWNAELKLIDRPTLIFKNVKLVEALENAFNFRPDYNSAKIDLESREIKIKAAKDELLPTLDLTGSLSLNGLDESYEEAIDKVNSDYKDWSVGVKLSLPWGAGNRAEYDRKKLEKTQALLAFMRLQQKIILDVRDRVREIDIQYRQVQAAELSKEKEIKNHEAQEMRYAAGEVSTHDMLDYQDRLSQSELDCIKALIDYNNALIELDEAEGLTLIRNDIKLEE